MKEESLPGSLFGPLFAGTVFMDHFPISEEFISGKKAGEILDSFESAMKSRAEAWVNWLNSNIELVRPLVDGFPIPSHLFGTPKPDSGLNEKKELLPTKDNDGCTIVGLINEALNWTRYRVTANLSEWKIVDFCITDSVEQRWDYNTFTGEWIEIVFAAPEGLMEKSILISALEKEAECDLEC